MSNPNRPQANNQHLNWGAQPVVANIHGQNIMFVGDNGTQMTQATHGRGGITSSQLTSALQFVNNRGGGVMSETMSNMARSYDPLGGPADMAALQHSVSNDINLEQMVDVEEDELPAANYLGGNVVAVARDVHARHVPTTQTAPVNQFNNSTNPQKSINVTIVAGMDMMNSLMVKIEASHRFATSINKSSQTLGDLFHFYANEMMLPVERLEFSHVDTFDDWQHFPDQCRLMSNDEIIVRLKNESKSGVDKKEKDEEMHAIELNYFRELHALEGSDGADIIFDCMDTIDGQKLLSTSVRGHSAVLSKRCEFVAEKIRSARQLFSPPTTIPTNDAAQPNTPTTPGVNVIADGSGSDESGDDEIDTNNGERNASTPMNNIIDNEKPLLRISLSNHHPKAVKLLLEYCYTNRCLGLGTVAFTHVVDLKREERLKKEALEKEMGVGNISNNENKSDNKTYQLPSVEVLNQELRDGTHRDEDNNNEDEVLEVKHNKQIVKSEVYASEMPELPTVSFSVAISALELGLEAKMASFSLMCELAAAALIDSQNVARALAQCSLSLTTYGNGLPHLKQAALEYLKSPTNVVAVSTDKVFLSTLTKQGEYIVDDLLKGTAMAMPHKLAKKRKRVVDVVVVGGRMRRGGEERSYSQDAGAEQLFKKEYVTRKRVAMSEVEEEENFYATVDLLDKKLREEERSRWKQPKQLPQHP